MIFYFGCWGRPGHYWYAPGRLSVDRNMRSELGNVDGTLAPTYGDDEAKQGHAHFEQRGKWACISFWDRCGDKRGASNSTFALHGEHTFDEVLAAARVSFPQLFERFDFVIVEV